MAIADKLNLLRTTKAAIKAAIEAKGQEVGDAAFSAYPEKIMAIETGTSLPELTNPGAAGDLLSGKQLIDQEGRVLEGSMPTVVQATPSISVSAAGLITASAQQGAGYVAAGSKSATQQLSTQGAKSVRPGTVQQTAVEAGKYTTGAVTVEGSAALIPGNIKSGVSIFGVSGNYEGAELKYLSITSNYAQYLSIVARTITVTLPSAVSSIEQIQSVYLLISGCTITVDSGGKTYNQCNMVLVFPISHDNPFPGSLMAYTWVMSDSGYTLFLSRIELNDTRTLTISLSGQISSFSSATGYITWQGA